MERLETMYAEVGRRLSGIPFSGIFEGFRPFGFALYDGAHAILRGQIIDRPESFIANTSVPYGGENVAIWNAEDFDGDYDELTAGIVHEMFHCFQAENGETRYPSDLELLAYPDLPENHEWKYRENLLIAGMIRTGNAGDLAKVVRCRNVREGMIGDFALQEYRAETIEGSAEYAGTAALRCLSEEKYRKRVERYCDMITGVSDALFDIRRISYASGTLLSILYRERGFRFPVSGEKTLYETVRGGIGEVEVSPPSYPEIRAALRETLRRREAAIRTFREAHPVFTEKKATVCGYDPMNMIRCGDEVLCSHFVFLKADGETLPLMRPVLLKMEKNDCFRVVGYYG